MFTFSGTIVESASAGAVIPARNREISFVDALTGNPVTFTGGLTKLTTDSAGRFGPITHPSVTQIKPVVNGFVSDDIIDAPYDYEAAIAAAVADGALADAAVASAVGTDGDARGALDARYNRKSQTPVYAADYVDGDGFDEAVGLNAAFAAAAGGVLEFPRNVTIRADSAVTVPSDITVRGNGATLDFSGIPAGTTLGQRIAMLAQGTLGAALTVTTAVTQWSRTIAGISSTATLAAGDLILLRNDERPVLGMTRTDRDKGEIAMIQSVDSSTQVTLVTGAVFAYGTTGLGIQKITPVKDIVIEGLNVKLGGVGKAHNAIQVRYGRNITVRGNTFDGAEDICVSMNTVWNSKVYENDIRNSTSSLTLGNTGYGVAIVEGSKHALVKDNHFHNCRHFVAGGGYWPPTHVDVVSNQGQNASDAAYDCHEPCFYWNFQDNWAVGVASGFIIRGQYVTVRGNHIIDSLGRAYRASTFDGVTEQRGVRFIDNEAVRSTYGLEVDGQAAGAEPNCLKIGVEISRNKLIDCGANPILLRHFDGAKLAENEIEGSTSHAILILGLSGTQSTKLRMRGNDVKNSGADSIKIQYVDDLQIVGGQIVSAGTSGVELLNCNRTKIDGLQIVGHVQNGIFVSAGTIHQIVGCQVTGGTTNTYDALRFSGTSVAEVVGGYYAGARYGVNATTTSSVIITNVNAKDAVGSAGVKINSDATSKIVTNNFPDPNDFGVVGNNVADDTTGFNSFLTASVGKVVTSTGTYKVTANLPNLHAVRHRGQGKVVRDAVTFYLEPSGTQTNTIYVSPTGNNANDGITPALPKQTIQAAFDAIANYGPMLNGNWVVELAAGTYPIAGNQALLTTPSLNRVIVKGPAVVSPAVPTAILDGAGGAAYTHGLRAFGAGVQAEFRDIKAINFTAGAGDDSRIGFVGENGADLLTTNCHVTGATWCGIYGFSATRLRVYGGILDGCRSGVVSNDSPSTIGATGAGVVLIKNSTESGIYWSRGSQGHIDYCTFEDNAVALLVAENSRVDTVANTFNRNSYAIRTQTGGVWGEGGAPNVYGTGADVNPNGNNDFAFSGNNAELVLATSEKRVAYDRTTRTLTGTTSATVMTTPYTIPANRMLGAGKSCRVVVLGVFTAATAGTVMTVAFGGMSLPITIPAAATNLTFELEVTLLEVQGGYRAIGKIAQGLSAHRFGTVTSGFVNTIANAITVSATPANAADNIAIYRTDVYLTG